MAALKFGDVGTNVGSSLEGERNIFLFRSRKVEKGPPLATPETDGSLGESTISKLSRLNEEKKSKDATEGSPSASRNKILFMKDIGPDNYITTTFT
ncbi:unnamed protein product [Arctia plantaginis]|uniref:Uncharacterized protein n=1 Tax=Arctia plantaginis TaxID=874455 RepID=A0A8S1BF56_ARCPL|nr:unnamed protein product [Arctia plantaginis]